ncbi:DCL family protein [Rhodoplanes roseus]|uniref:DCL family protein n=1 Tax=Rhodoplanes roseus TaxID=29409 RepID=UPI001AECBF77
MGGRSKPVELATRSFEKQGDATAFFKAMLNRYRPGERVNDEDALDVAALLERHTEYVAKVGCGVRHFQVMMTEHGTQCFRIIRMDGSGTDFSYPHCITQRPPSRKQCDPLASRRCRKWLDRGWSAIWRSRRQCHPRLARHFSANRRCPGVASVSPGRAIRFVQGARRLLRDARRRERQCHLCGDRRADHPRRRPYGSLPTDDLRGDRDDIPLRSWPLPRKRHAHDRAGQSGLPRGNGPDFVRGASIVSLVGSAARSRA